MSKNVMSFKDILLSIDNNYNIHLIDERLSTIEAHRTLNELNVRGDKRKSVVDTYAACEILDTYIRSVK